MTHPGDNNLVWLIGGAVVLLFILVGLIILWRRRTNRITTTQVTDRWQALQKNCGTRKTWPIAIAQADDLLNDVLKSRHYKGKTTGERLVAAQHELTSNDTVWFGHKLRNQLVGQDVRTLKKQDIINALAGFRQALKDMGAMK